MSKASLIVGNSNWAIKDSSLLGYNINDSNIYSPFPFDVTRASAATTVNKAGLIVTDTEIISGELITNGDFDTDSDWAKNPNWTISGGTANCDGTSDGTLFQTNVIEDNKEYSISYTISNLTQGKINISLSGTDGVKQDSNGTYTEVIKSGTSPSGRLSIECSSSPICSIENVSVVEVNRNNLARIDYTDSTKGVLLTEPQSTNFANDSINLLSWGTPFEGTGLKAVVTSNFAISPDGTQNADKVVFNINGGTTSSDYSQVQISVGTKTGNFTNSVYMKSNTADSYQVVLGDPLGGPVLKTVTPEWSRFDATSIGVSSQTTSLRIRLRGHESTSQYADVSIWGAQLEEQSFATSYIPTNGSIVTRNQDQVTNGGEVSTFNSEEGVLFAEIAALANATPQEVSLAISEGQSGANRLLIRMKTNGAIGVVLRVANTTQADINSSALNQSVSHKVAVKWKLNDIALWIDGVEVGTDSLANVFAANTLDKVSFNQGNNSNYFFGKTSQIQVFKKALTDSELQILTTI